MTKYGKTKGITNMTKYGKSERHHRHDQIGKNTNMIKYGKQEASQT